MKTRLMFLVIPFSLFSLNLQASCLSGDEVIENRDAALFLQTSYINRAPSVWKIAGENAYTAKNVLHDAGVKFNSRCAVIENKLDLDFSLYGLTYYSWQMPGWFEKDNHRSRILLDQLQLAYTLSDDLRLEGGKLQPKTGMFFLKSPSSLISNYYAGFKESRLYDPAVKSAYSESLWGARLIKDSRDYTLSLTVAPQLAQIRQRYESSSNWSSNQRANASERYLLSYTDYRLAGHTPSVNLLLGDSRSIALSDSFNATPQFVINAELALHSTQQWRHFSPEKAAEVEGYAFPSSLYGTQDKEGVELAIGGQYTTDSFDVLGVEYYFQSEGYSRAQWQQHADFVRYLNTKTPYSSLNDAFDAYKYLMAAEISNAANRGNLQGKHYLNTYASLRYENGATVQPFMVLNMVDYSTMLGLHYSTPLERFDENLELYAGSWAALGRDDAEFSLFGKTLGVYFGFKYLL